LGHLPQSAHHRRHAGARPRLSYEIAKSSQAAVAREVTDERFVHNVTLDEGLDSAFDYLSRTCRGLPKSGFRNLTPSPLPFASMKSIVESLMPPC